MVSGIKRVRRRDGLVLEIALPDGRFSYCRTLSEPLIEFFEGCYDDRISFGSLNEYKVSFKIWVHNDAITTGRWKVIGRTPLCVDTERPWFYQQDAITDKVCLYQHGTGATKVLDISELPSYEAAAIWDPEQIEERLIQECSGKTSEFVEKMRAETISKWMKRYAS